MGVFPDNVGKSEPLRRIVPAAWEAEIFPFLKKIQNSIILDSRKKTNKIFYTMHERSECLIIKKFAGVNTMVFHLLRNAGQILSGMIMYT